MYKLEYRYFDHDSEWKTFITLERQAAIDMLYAAQISDTINDIERAWRINPSPWAPGQ